MPEQKKLEGLWDCPYCGAKAIGGLKKHCPNCGHPQDDGTKFYLGEEKIYLDEKTAENYGKGADWTCAYCGSMNRFDATECSNCGAPREETTGSYFDNQKKNEEIAKREDEELHAAERQEAAAARTAAQRKRKTGCAIIAAILAIILIISIIPKKKSASVSDKSWKREILTEDYVTVTEQDWAVPNDGRIVSSENAVHHYEQVLDGYVDQPQERSREKFDGYDTEVVYHDNGDGTFSEEVVQTERYVTEYYTEYVSVPVYHDEPVYMTLYTYEIERWKEGLTFTAAGGEDTPYWPAVELGSNQRESGRTEQYVLEFTADGGKTYRMSCSEDLWSQYKVGKSVDLKVNGSSVVELDGAGVH